MPLLLPAFTSLSIGCGSAGTNGSTDRTRTDPSAEQPGTGAQTLYDGESLFRGIFFGTGEVAEKLPEIWRSQEQAKLAVLTPEQTAARLEAGGSQLRALGYAEQADRLGLLASQVRNGALSPKDIARVADGKFSVADRTAPEAVATYDSAVASIKGLDSGFFNRFAAEIQSGNQVRVANAIREASKLLLESTNLGVDPTKLAKGEQSVGCPTCDPPCGGGGQGGIGGGGGGGDGDFHRSADCDPRRCLRHRGGCRRCVLGSTAGRGQGRSAARLVDRRHYAPIRDLTTRKVMWHPPITALGADNKCFSRPGHRKAGRPAGLTSRPAFGQWPGKMWHHDLPFAVSLFAQRSRK